MGLPMPNHHTLWSVNVSDFAQNFRIHFFGYINGEIFFLFLTTLKGFLSVHLKKKFHVLKIVKYMNFNDYQEYLYFGKF